MGRACDCLMSLCRIRSLQVSSAPPQSLVPLVHAELDDLTATPQGIERVGMHPERDQVSSAERAALFAEGLQCGLETAGFHLGKNGTTGA